MAKAWADWTVEQVAHLWRWQASNAVHPFTCPNRGDGKHFELLGDTGTLIPTRRGWICLACEYEQDWAHDFMLDAHGLRHEENLLNILAATKRKP